jgi:hypothetical protein
LKYLLIFSLIASVPAAVVAGAVVIRDVRDGMKAEENRIEDKRRKRTYRR